MHTMFVILHALLALSLIGVILVQTGKGADIGAAFGGGSSQTVFGARGPTTFLHRLTIILAVLIMVTSIVLTIHATRLGPASVIPEEPAQTAPAAPTSPQ
ncbi:MAG: preprotein translocase subunit SecG [candidate division NC10 bacterium]|nr:preprotein translocase subunit SecG [candidate division NC10 bacterium]